MVPLLFIGLLAIVSAYFQTAVSALVWNNVTLVERDVDLKWMSPPAKELARFASRLEPSHVIWILERLERRTRGGAGRFPDFLASHPPSAERLEALRSRSKSSK